jgi:hypothetical protein
MVSLISTGCAAMPDPSFAGAGLMFHRVSRL